MTFKLIKEGLEELAKAIREIAPCKHEFEAPFTYASREVQQCKKCHQVVAIFDRPYVGQ